MFNQLLEGNGAILISTLAFFVSFLSLILSFKNWKIAKSKFGEEKRSLFLNFSKGVENLKSIYLLFHSLTIKNLEDINLNNLKKDKSVLEQILKKMESSESSLINSNITQPSYFNLLREIPELITEIDSLQKIEFLELDSLSRKIGFVYYNAYLMQPTVYPKSYKIPDFDREKSFIIFFNDLVFNK